MKVFRHFAVMFFCCFLIVCSVSKGKIQYKIAIFVSKIVLTE